MLKKIFIVYCIFFVGILSADSSLPTVKKLVGLIRFKKNEQAIELIDVKTFSKNLFKQHWEKLDPKDQDEFIEAMSIYIKNKPFVTAREYFDKIDINYAKPKTKGKSIEIPSSIIYKGSDKINFSWVLSEESGKMKIVDFIDPKGSLASEQFGTTQIIPNYEKKGIKELIELVKKKAKD
jgi:ABC-type transporter MlaC component